MGTFHNYCILETSRFHCVYKQNR